jgi:hypothetical protein
VGRRVGHYGAARERLDGSRAAPQPPPGRAGQVHGAGGAACDRGG